MFDFDQNRKNSMTYKRQGFLSYLVILIFDSKSISIESSLHAEHNDISFSFVRPTTAAKKLKAPRKHLSNWMHSVMYSTL